MRFNTFFGIEKNPFVFDWRMTQNPDSFIIQYRVMHKSRNCEKLREHVFVLFFLHCWCWLYAIWTQHTKWEPRCINWALFLIFSFFGILWPKKWKKCENWDFSSETDPPRVIKKMKIKNRAQLMPLECLNL